MNAQAIEVHRAEQTVVAPSNPMEMLSRAIERGVSPETLGQLISVQERWEMNAARKAFDAAIAAAKAEIPVIHKNREVDFTSSKGRTNYRYEDLAEVARTVNPILAKHGLSYRYRTHSVPNEPVTVTCIVSHRDGYSEENTLSAGRDDSGNKNSIQAIGSTLTYLQRMTLKAALGLAASDDDDGKASSDPDTISGEQIDHIRSLIVETGSDIPRFVKYFKIERIEDMPSRDYDRAVASLEKKRTEANG
jgi:hypothetical protein